MALRRLIATAALAALVSTGAEAHFQEILPSADVLPDGGALTVDLLFTHPMAGGPVMAMQRPRRFGMLREGVVQDLTATLAERPVDGKLGWSARLTLDRPGAAILFVEPQPYWEAAEGKYIAQSAKVIVDSYASGIGWDRLVGLPVEIRPLVRPTGLWTGNLFRGLVLRAGKPAPFAVIEVEYVNDGSVRTPNDAFLTQVILAGPDATFAYAMPRAGWWGFAAILAADKPMAGPDGKDAPVEEGGAIWVRATDMTGGN